MSHTNLVGAIQRQLDYCNTPVRRSRITRRWARNEPTLDGVGIDEILDHAAIPTPAQNPLLRSLLRLHQGGDADAGTVLMAAAIPMIKRVAAARCRSERGDRDDEMGNLWGAFGHMIATINPDVDLCDQTDDDVERPMMTYFGSRLGGSHDVIEPDEARDRRAARRTRHIRLATTVEHSGGEVEMFIEYRTDVAELAIAEIELTRIAEAVASGKISAQSWRELIEHRVDRIPAPPGCSPVSRRLRAMRTARQLSGLVGHAA